MINKFIFYLVKNFTISRFCRSDRLRDLLMWPVTSRLLGQDFTAVIERNNYKIKVDLKDQLNRMLLFFGSSVEYLWEPQTTKLAQILIKDKKTSIIAGSHIGYINLELLGSLSQGGVIHTFEPVAYLYGRSSENIKLNNAGEKIKLHSQALGASSGEGTMYVEDLRSSLIPYTFAHTKHNNTEFVTVVTLDQFKKGQHIEKIDFLFLDIEGFEEQAFFGAQEIIVHDKPTIIFEMSPKILAAVNRDPRQLYDFLTTAGYRLFVIEDNYNLRNVRSWNSRPLSLVPLTGYNITMSYVNIVAVQNEEGLFNSINSYNIKLQSNISIC